LVLVAFCYSSPGVAAVYKWIDHEGVVHYSDEPEAGAKRITLPELSVVPFRVPVAPVPEPQVLEPAPAESPDPLSATDGYYRQLAIRLPANNQTLTTPVDEVDVELVLSPDLGGEHHIQVLLDGQRVRDELRTTRFTISGFEPGSHILEARVVDPEGNTVRRSKSVLFHYQP